MLRRFLPVLVAGAAVSLLLASAAWSRAQATPTLVGTTGPGFTITLKMNGKAVKALHAGTYKLVVHDKASIHNFVLEKEKGGTFERDVTTVPFVGTKTITVKLTTGTYKYYCRPHEKLGMGHLFTVM